jgi:hypothetical protein
MLYSTLDFSLDASHASPVNALKLLASSPLQRTFPSLKTQFTSLVSRKMNLGHFVETNLFLFELWVLKMHVVYRCVVRQYQSVERGRGRVYRTCVCARAVIFVPTHDNGHPLRRRPRLSSPPVRQTWTRTSLLSMGYPRTPGSGFISSRAGRHFITFCTMTSCALRAPRSPRRSPLSLLDFAQHCSALVREHAVLSFHVRLSAFPKAHFLFSAPLLIPFRTNRDLQIRHY